jgi:hypothetical protein
MTKASLDLRQSIGFCRYFPPFRTKVSPASWELKWVEEGYGYVVSETYISRNAVNIGPSCDAVFLLSGGENELTLLISVCGRQGWAPRENAERELARNWPDAGVRYQRVLCLIWATLWLFGSRGSSVSIVSDYGPDDRGSIPGGSRGFFL